MSFLDNSQNFDHYNLKCLLTILNGNIINSGLRGKIVSEFAEFLVKYTQEHADKVIMKKP